MVQRPSRLVGSNYWFTYLVINNEQINRMKIASHGWKWNLKLCKFRSLLKHFFGTKYKSNEEDLATILVIMYIYATFHAGLHFWDFCTVDFRIILILQWSPLLNSFHLNDLSKFHAHWVKKNLFEEMANHLICLSLFISMWFIADFVLTSTLDKRINELLIELLQPTTT